MAQNKAPEPWVSKLNDELACWEQGSLDYTFASCLRGRLQSKTTPRAISSAIERTYDNYLRANPQLKSAEDKGWVVFISSFYKVVFVFAKYIPHNCEKQDSLIKALLELRRLPPRQIKIRGENCAVWTSEPLSDLAMEEAWKKNHPVFNQSLRSPDASASRINLSAFLARYLAAGLRDQYRPDQRYRLPAFDIIKGLEIAKLNQPGLLRRCMQMVAVTWIRYASSAIERMCLEWDNNLGVGPEGWERWKVALRILQIRDDGDQDLREAAGIARTGMTGGMPLEMNLVVRTNGDVECLK